MGNLNDLKIGLREGWSAKVDELNGKERKVGWLREILKGDLCVVSVKLQW
jgi:hypothetical protein